MNTVINPDIQTYAGPQPPPQVPSTFPLWMFSPVLPPVIAVNVAMMNALVAQGFAVTYQSPYPVPNVPPQSVTAILPPGVTDSLAPAGYVAGVTARLELVPTDATSTLAGLVAASDGWTISVINPSHYASGMNPSNAQPLTILNKASQTAGNSFVLPSGNNLVIAPQEGAFFQWVAAVNGWMYVS